MMSLRSYFSPTEECAVSYLHLRRAVGVIGIGLPFVLALGACALNGTGIQSSISAYYYTVMRNVFVGSLWALGVFFWSYRAYELRDVVAGHIAGISAIGVSLFRTTPDHPAHREVMLGRCHFSFAACFFLTLAYFSYYLFTETGSNPTPRKLLRNSVYRTCGRVMVGCIIAIAAYNLLWSDTRLKAWQPVFVLESTAIMAFGVSWFIKGETILRDI